MKVECARKSAIISGSHLSLSREGEIAEHAAAVGFQFGLGFIKDTQCIASIFVAGFQRATHPREHRTHTPSNRCASRHQGRSAAHRRQHRQTAGYWEASPAEASSSFSAIRRYRWRSRTSGIRALSARLKFSAAWARYFLARLAARRRSSRFSPIWGPEHTDAPAAPAVHRLKLSSLSSAVQLVRGVGVTTWQFESDQNCSDCFLRLAQPAK